MGCFSRTSAGADRESAAMYPDHHRPPRAIESWRPQVEIKAVLRMRLLNLHCAERLVGDWVLMSNRAKAPRIANSRPRRWFLGSEPSPNAVGSGREWHSFEDAQAVLFLTFESSVAGRYDRAHILCPRHSIRFHHPSITLWKSMDGRTHLVLLDADFDLSWR